MTTMSLKLSAFATLMMLIAAPAYAGVNQTADNPLAITQDDVVLGDPNAKITMIEYASMTCGHCAHFHNDTFAKIKENYVETGKIKFVLRDLPWDAMATAVTKITRCVPDDKFYGYVSAFFSTQKTWTHAADPLAELKKVARLGGMDDKTFEACLTDPKVHNEVLANRTIAIEKLQVGATPTFFIGPDIMVQGALPYEEMAKKIDEALKNAE